MDATTDEIELIAKQKADPSSFTIGELKKLMHLQAARFGEGNVVYCYLVKADGTDYNVSGSSGNNQFLMNFQEMGVALCRIVTKEKN